MKCLSSQEDPSISTAMCKSLGAPGESLEMYRREKGASDVLSSCLLKSVLSFPKELLPGLLSIQIYFHKMSWLCGG